MATVEPLVVIVGETGSGKSALALKVAERWNGEIIAADSRTLYRGMDIGTAKPSLAERRKVPHHLIDAVNPDESFSVADFQWMANQTIEQVIERGHLPIIVGGTGLYVDALLYNYTFREKPDPAHREVLSAMTVQELQEAVMDRGLPMPQNANNPRNLIRTIESEGKAGMRQKLRDNTIVIGLRLEQHVLRKKIETRVDQMFAQGLKEEVKKVVDTYGWGCEALKGIGYREFEGYFTGDKTLPDVRKEIVKDTLGYAKRQRTWFKRNADIIWCDSPEQCLQTIESFLNKHLLQ